MMMKQENGIWGERKTAPFSGKFRDVDPFITHDGTRLYFSSNRSLDGKNKNPDCDFWFVERNATDRWGEPIHVEYPSTSQRHDFYYTTTREGAVYFSVFDENDTGDIYTLEKSDTEIQKRRRLPAGINTEYNEHDPFIAPDESYLIFTSNRPGGQGSGDLYISFKKRDASWSEPQNMGSDINSSSYDYCAILSPDGKYLFFSSSRTGNGDIYWVDAKIIENYSR